MFRFLLEGVKNVNRRTEAHRIYGAIGITALILNQFHDAAAKSFQGFGGRWVLSRLSEEQLVPELMLHAIWKLPKVFEAGTNPSQRPDGRRQRVHVRIRNMSINS